MHFSFTKIQNHFSLKIKIQPEKKATTKRVWIRSKHSVSAFFSYKRIKMKKFIKSINQTRGASAELPPLQRPILYQFGTFSFASNYVAHIITKIKYIKTTVRLWNSHLKSRGGGKFPPCGRPCTIHSAKSM